MALLPRALVSLLILLFGCGDDDDDATSPAIAVSATAPATAPPQSVIDAARADLAGRLAVPVARVTVLESCSFIWPDGSIGVAEPGRVYTQALVPGWLAILEHDGSEYRYHGAGAEFTAADFVFDAQVLAERCP